MGWDVMCAHFSSLLKSFGPHKDIFRESKWHEDREPKKTKNKNARMYVFDTYIIIYN